MGQINQTRLTEFRTKLGKDAIGSHAERTAESASAGAAVAAAAEVLGNAGDVNLPFAANAETELIDIGQFAQEDRSLDTDDADEIVRRRLDDDLTRRSGGASWTRSCE